MDILPAYAANGAAAVCSKLLQRRTTNTPVAEPYTSREIEACLDEGRFSAQQNFSKILPREIKLPYVISALRKENQRDHFMSGYSPSQRYAGRRRNKKTLHRMNDGG